MATSPDELRQSYEQLAKHVKTLLNNDLKIICRSEGLPVTGVKAALQQRVLNRKSANSFLVQLTSLIWTRP